MRDGVRGERWIYSLGIWFICEERALLLWELLIMDVDMVEDWGYV